MKYGYSVLPKWFNVPTFAFFIKKDLEKTNPFTELNIIRGDIVLEGGCFIGTFASACIEAGASIVTSFECEKRNYEFSLTNLKKYGNKIELINAALVSNDIPVIKIFLSGCRVANSVIQREKTKKFITVRAVNFRRQLIKLKPSVFKLDIEGAEYDIVESLQPGDLSSVREFYIEFHKHEQREERITKFEKFIESEGFFKTPGSKPRKFVAKRSL